MINILIIAFLVVATLATVLHISMCKMVKDTDRRVQEIKQNMLNNKVMANAEPGNYRCCMCSKKFNDGGTFKRYNGKWYCLDCYFKKREADKLLDLEQITGLSTDTLQEMENVSRIAGVSFDGLTDTITKWVSGCEKIKAGEE